MFGQYTHNFDPKGRLFVPSKLRDELGNTFYVMIGDDCLLAFPEQRWEKVMDTLNAAPLADAKLKRHILANVAKCEPDKQGRFVLPAKLRNYAGLNGDVTFLGQGDHAEIWDAAAYEASEDPWMADKSNLQNALRVLGL